MRSRVLTLAYIAVVLGGCSYPLPSDTVKTNAWMAAHKVVLPHSPASQGHYAPGTTITAEVLKAPFGPLHTVRIESDPKKPLIVLCGGRSFREEAHGAAIGEALAKFGDVMMYDYPGFGSSGGSGTRAEFAEAETVMAAKVKALAATRQGPVIFWGHSLGGGICSSLAAHSKVPSSLVLVTTFAAYDDFKDNLLGWFSPLISLSVPETTIAYNAPVLLKDYPGAIFVVTLTKDETVPYAVETRLADKLKAAGRNLSVVTIEGDGHAAIHERPDFQTAMAAALKAKKITAAE